jgi:hypothetical protein
LTPSEELAVDLGVPEELTDLLGGGGDEEGWEPMDGVVAHDARVWAILKTPDEYFARARREAWLHATEDVAADLDRRAQRRRDGSFEESARRRADKPSDSPH